MGDQSLSEAALQPLALSDYPTVMAKSRANRLAFATWLIFFRDRGRFPRGPSDLETLDIAALAGAAAVQGNLGRRRQSLSQPG